MKEYVYIAIRDEDGKEQLISPFVVKATPETSAAPEKNSVSNTCVELELKNVDEVLDYLRKHKDIIKSRRGDFDVHIDMTYELKVGVEVYHAHYEDDWDGVPAGWPDWAEQLAEENEKLGEFYRDLKKDKATQEKFDFALRYSDDLSKVNWKLAMK